LLLGYPLWWLLGVHSLLPLAMAAVMVVQLTRRRGLRLPPGFGFWLLFLAVVLLGVFVLWADAPNAVPGGGSSRLLVFGWRLGDYAVATIALVWIANLNERDLPTVLFRRLIAYTFVVTAIGGVLGVVLPAVDFPSAFEAVLPRGLRANEFVRSLVHPGFADVQHVLGYDQPRPKAPFPYTNTWGSYFALSLPFFVVAWLGRTAGRRRYVAPLILLAAAVPAVYSLNRGLWACLGVGMVLVAALLLRNGRIGPIVVALVLAVVAAVAFLASPLSGIYEQRLANQHSNDRRGQLTETTVLSTATGSPVIGFGSTRDLQGSFASIAGGSTPECPACGVPSLGTQGLLWGIVFGHGFLGALGYLAFLAASLSRCWRCRTTTETLCAFVLVFFGVQLLVYDTLGLPLLIVMLAIGSVSREQSRVSRGVRPHFGLGQLTERLRAAVGLFVVLALAGAAVGIAATLQRPQTHEAGISILLSPYPTSLGEQDTVEQAEQQTTVDTEAAILLSESVLSSAVARSGYSSTEDLRAALRVTAPTSTTVLRVTLRASSPEEAARTIHEVGKSFLAVREVYLSQRREQVLTSLRDKQRLLQATALRQLVVSESDLGSANEGRSLVEARSYQTVRAAKETLDDTIIDVLLTPTEAGTVIRVDPPTPVPRTYGVAVGSGIALGIATAAVVVALHEQPLRRRRRR
jgi:capsular polysaccharide biosynthesis protein